MVKVAFRPRLRMVSNVAALPAKRTVSAGGGAAKAYVDGIYAEYARTGNRPAYKRAFAAELLRLIEKDGQIANKQGEPNLIDYDLYCQCNDNGGLKFSTSVLSANAKTAVIRVNPTLNGQPTDLKPFILQMLNTANGWRISNIITSGKFGGSLLAYLKKGLGETSASVEETSPPVPAVVRPVALPVSIEYSGFTGSARFPVFNDFKITRSDSALGGSGFIQIGIFSGAAPLTGTYVNGECSVTRKKQIWRGLCDGNEFSGFIYDPKGKQGEPFRFRTEAYLARIKAGRGEAAPVAVANTGAPRAYTSVWSFGRARFLVEPRGGCPPEIALGTRSYCFTQAINWLRRHPDKQSVDVVAMDNAWLVGSLVPHNNGQGWDIYKVSRQGGGFAAGIQRHYSTQVKVPQGCIYENVAQQGWYIGTDHNGKVAIEAASYVCANGWSGAPIYARLLDTSEIDGAAGDIQFASSGSALSAPPYGQPGTANRKSGQAADWGGPQFRNNWLADTSANISGAPSNAADHGGPPDQRDDYLWGTSATISGQPDTARAPVKRKPKTKR